MKKTSIGKLIQDSVNHEIDSKRKIENDLDDIRMYTFLNIAEEFTIRWKKKTEKKPKDIEEFFKDLNLHLEEHNKLINIINKIKTKLASHLHRER